MKGAVQLRDIQQSDLPIFYEHQLDPDATRMAAFPSRDREAFIAHWNKILGDGTILKKTILYEGQVAGNLVCFGEPAERMVGYWVGKSFWGKGIATQALAAFLEIVKERPLFAHAAKHNLASLRVLEKCGFTPIGEASEPVEGGEPMEEIILVLGASER